MKSRYDYILAGLILCLIVFGILMLSGVSALYSWSKSGKTSYFLLHQIFLAIIPGLIAGFVAFKIPLEKLKKYAPVFLLINLGFLAVVLFYKLASGSNEASRWIQIGPLSLQPSEFLKLTFILYLASWINAKITPSLDKRKKIGFQKYSKRNFNPEKRHKQNFHSASFIQRLIPFFVIVGIVTIFLTLQPNISTLGIIVFTGFLMYWAAETPTWHSFLIILVGIAVLALLIKIAPYRFDRFLVFIQPDTDPMGKSFQIHQSLIAVGSGGIWGRGLGMSYQKLGFLPESMSDSIFAVFAEEAGLIGSLLLITIFLMIFWRGIQVSKNAPDQFSKLIALGISCWFIIQTFVNIGAMIGVLPLTGIPMPFVSYGGSHLIAELIGVGILLNISRYSIK